MAAIKAVLLDTHELVERMVKNEELLAQLRITDWQDFTAHLATELIELGWTAPSARKTK